jgi:hypothetical protein
MEARPSEKKRKTAGPSYDALWWRFYEQTKDARSVITLLKIIIQIS